MDIDKLTAVLRDHAASGVYGNAFLIMRSTTRDALREQFRPALPWRDATYQLTGIPIMLDNGCEVAWRLIDRTTGGVLVSDASQT